MRAGGLGKQSYPLVQTNDTLGKLVFRLISSPATVEAGVSAYRRGTLDSTRKVVEEKRQHLTKAHAKKQRSTLQ